MATDTHAAAVLVPPVQFEEQTWKPRAPELYSRAEVLRQTGRYRSTITPAIADDKLIVNWDQEKGSFIVALDAATQAAELEQARANRELARSTQQRNQELFEKKFISKQALDASAATLRVQEAAVALAEAKLGKTQIRAPFAGVIGIRSVSIGDYVKEGQDLINLEDIATLKVDFRLPEATLPQLKLGQPLDVTVDALPGEKFTATLDAVDPLVDAGGRSISLRARLDNKAGTLRPGMFVRVRLALAEKADALMLPEQSLVPDPAGAFVYRVVEGKAEKVKVKTGVRRESQVHHVFHARAFMREPSCRPRVTTSRTRRYARMCRRPLTLRH